MKNIVLTFLLAIAGMICSAQKVDTLTIQSKVLNDTRKIQVVLPKGYGQYQASHPNKDRNYMVAYFFDAQDKSMFDLCKATVNYLSGPNQSYSEPLILVGIPNRERWHDFLPKALTEEGSKHYKGNGGAELLAVYLRDEVMPLINSKYNVKPYNIGIGHSLGGTFVTYCMLKHPELFNAGIAVSPNFAYDEEQMVRTFDNLATEKILNHKFLYIALGYGDEMEEQFKPATQKVANLLKKKNIPGFKWQVEALDIDSHGLTHAEGILKGLYRLYKQMNLSDVQMNSYFNNKSKPFMSQVKEYYASASLWSGMKLPTTEEVNLKAGNLLAFKHDKESIEFYDWGISLYPDDSNLYDSAAESETAMGDKAAALKYYTEALEMLKRTRSKLTESVYNGKVASFEKNIVALKK